MMEVPTPGIRKTSTALWPR